MNKRGRRIETQTEGVDNSRKLGDFSPQVYRVLFHYLFLFLFMDFILAMGG